MSSYFCDNPECFLHLPYDAFGGVVVGDQIQMKAAGVAEVTQFSTYDYETQSACRMQLNLYKQNFKFKWRNTVRHLIQVEIQGVTVSGTFCTQCAAIFDLITGKK